MLVIHDWDGLTRYEEKRADMLAELGYDALAIAKLRTEKAV